MFKCIVCGKTGGENVTTHKPRDRKELSIVDCPECGHRQLFPLLSDEELAEEYAEDKTVRATAGVQIAPGSDFESMRKKFSEWTQIHADMYWPVLQGCKKVMNLGSGYGFLEEELNKRPGKSFEIVGNEIGRFRLDHYVGGDVCTVNFATDAVPDDMRGEYDLVMGLHILEHINAPVDYVSNLKPLLSSQGKVIMEVPNLKSFLCELSPEYKEFFYLYEHVSYFTEETLALVFEKAGYRNIKTYTEELYSIENHINWIRTGKPFINYNQMFLPDERIEFINEIYKRKVGEMGKGYALICEASL